MVQKMNLRRIRRRVAKMKFFMIRSYSWINIPAMIAVVVGVLAPYIQKYYNINVIWLGIIVFGGMLLFGLIDNLLGISKAELSFEQEQNILELGYLERIEEKLNRLLENRNG